MKSRIWILAAVLAVMATPVLATELPYSFVQGSWASVDPDTGGDDGTGPMLDVSWGLTNLVHAVGSYETVDFDSADMTMWQVGAGVHRSMSQGFDLFGEATYVDAEVDVPLGGTVSDEGYALCGGARKKLAQSWEINGGIEHIDVGDGDDTLLGVAALYSMKDRYAVGAGYKMGDSDTLHVGFRVSFGRR
jgi:hypothetical protein